MFRDYLTALTAAVASLNLATTAISSPTVPSGFFVEKFVDISGPTDLDVDSVGNIYVGHDDGGGFDPIRIRRVTPIGTVTEIGDPISDPDAIIIDVQGDTVAAGHIIVGGDLHFVEVAPDTGATSIEFTGLPQYNIQEMAFDSTGRLFAGHYGGGFVTVIDSGVLSLFYEFSGSTAGAVAVDENDRLFVGLQGTGQVFAFDLTSPGPPSLLATIPGVPLRFGYTNKSGPFSSALFVGTEGGEVYSVDRSSGDFELFASGFGTAHGIAFGPDGSMFVSDHAGNAIYRVTVPEPSASLLIAVALIAKLMSRRLYSLQ